MLKSQVALEYINYRVYQLHTIKKKTTFLWSFFIDLNDIDIFNIVQNHYLRKSGQIDF